MQISIDRVLARLGALFIETQCQPAKSSDKRYIGDVNDNAQVCPVTDQLLQATPDFGYQKAIFQGVSLAFGAPLDFFKDSLIQADNSSCIFFKIHGLLMAFAIGAKSDLAQAISQLDKSNMPTLNQQKACRSGVACHGHRLKQDACCLLTRSVETIEPGD